jgi:predicted nucleotidyltransferase
MEYNKKDDALQCFMQQIRERLGSHLKQIILFGSRARGEEVPGSDYDCLIIVDEVTNKIKDIIDEVAGEALYQHGSVFSAFLISEEKHNRYSYNPLLMNIAKEGMIL